MIRLKSKINSILIKIKLIKNIIKKKSFNQKIIKKNNKIFQINLIFNKFNKFQISMIKNMKIINLIYKNLKINMAYKKMIVKLIIINKN